MQSNSDAFIAETKDFSQFFRTLLKSALNFKQIQKKMTLIADVCPKLRTS